MSGKLVLVVGLAMAGALVGVFVAHLLPRNAQQRSENSDLDLFNGKVAPHVVFDFGTTYQGEVLERVLHLQNGSTENKTVSIQTSCRCTHVDRGGLILPAGALGDGTN